MDGLLDDHCLLADFRRILASDPLLQKCSGKKRVMQPLLLLYLWNPRYNAAENLMNKLIGLSTFSSDPLKKLELSTADKFSLVKDIGKLFKKLE